MTSSRALLESSYKAVHGRLWNPKRATPLRDPKPIESSPQEPETHGGIKWYTAPDKEWLSVMESEIAEYEARTSGAVLPGNMAIGNLQGR